jgi:hypothetical protein
LPAGVELLSGGSEEEPVPDVASAGVGLFSGAVELVAAGFATVGDELFKGGRPPAGFALLRGGNPPVGRGAAGAGAAGLAAGFVAAAGFEGGFLKSS